MKIVHVASELFPLIKTGGLADAVAAMAKALADFGHDVSVILPGFRGVLDHPEFAPARLEFEISVEMGDEFLRGEVYRLPLGKRRSLFVVRRDEFFDRRAPYGIGTRDYDDNAERFIFFNKAVIEILRLAEIKADVVHCHDWQAGLVPVLLRAAEQRYDESLALSTVLTIHNIAFQGVFPHRAFELTNLPEDFYSVEGLEYYGQMSMLKSGIVFADRITTVSPTYAKEIRTAQFGCGLEGVINSRAADLIGLLNGLDGEVWNPATDGLLPANYSADDLSGKQTCRERLLERSGFDPEFDGPVFGIVARFAHQKGFDLILGVKDFFLEKPVRLILLGGGDPRYETAFRELVLAHPGRVSLTLGLNEGLSHLLEAGSDFFLMPSIFEPCGLNQMYSMRYGTVPIVTRVGGLADTVTDFETSAAEGTGIVVEPEVGSLRKGLARALALYADKPKMAQVIQNGMRHDFSWTKAARGYEALYRDIV
jgi:starch synthase